MTTTEVAYNEGWNAAGRAVDADENPYNPLVEPELNREWRRGWDEGATGVTNEQGESNMSNKPFEICGVKGLNSKPFRKVFKSQAAYEKWLDANGENVTVYASRDVE